MGEAIVISVIVMSIAAAKIFRGPFGDALAHRLVRSDRSSVDAEAEARVAQLETRLAEVEERLDFAERLLAATKERGTLPEGVNR